MYYQLRTQIAEGHCRLMTESRKNTQKCIHTIELCIVQLNTHLLYTLNYLPSTADRAKKAVFASLVLQFVSTIKSIVHSNKIKQNPALRLL